MEKKKNNKRIDTWYQSFQFNIELMENLQLQGRKCGKCIIRKEVIPLLILIVVRRKIEYKLLQGVQGRKNKIHWLQIGYLSLK